MTTPSGIISLTDICSEVGLNTANGFGQSGVYLLAYGNNSHSLGTGIDFNSCRGKTKPQPYGTNRGQHCIGYDLYTNYANGAYGTYDVVNEYNSGSCGYVAPSAGNFGDADGGGDGGDGA